MATLTVNTTLAAGAVTNTKLADMAQGTVKGRAAGAGTGDPQDLTPDQASAILDAATDPFVRTSNLPADTGITQLTGDVTAGPGSGSQTATIAANAVTTGKIADNNVTIEKLQTIQSAHLLGRHGANTGNVQQVGIDGGLEIQGQNIRRAALTGDVTAPAGSNTTTIANDAVTNAKLANMATTTIKGRVSAGAGDPEDLSASQARTVLGLGTAALVNTGTGSGDVPTITQADERYIQQSLMDAKGDIISASADNTPVRVPVGVNGSVLTADSGATAGVSWGYQRGIHVPLVPSSGAYCIASVNGVALTTVNGAAGRLSLYPFIPCETFSVDRLDIEVTTNVAASNCKLAIYASSGSVPGDLIVGTGDISTAANGVFGQAITSTQLIAGTVYWLAIHYSSNQAVRAIPVGGCYGFQYPGAGGTAQSTVRNVTSAYGSGLPNPPVGTTTTSVQIPAIMLRVA